MDGRSLSALLHGVSRCDVGTRCLVVPFLTGEGMSRSRMLWTKATGVTLALVAVVAVNWVVMAIFIAADATDLTLAGLTGGTVHLLALGLAFAAIALCRRRERTPRTRLLGGR